MVSLRIAKALSFNPLLFLLLSCLPSLEGCTRTTSTPAITSTPTSTSTVAITTTPLTTTPFACNPLCPESIAPIDPAGGDPGGLTIGRSLANVQCDGVGFSGTGQTAIMQCYDSTDGGGAPFTDYDMGLTDMLGNVLLSIDNQRGAPVTIVCVDGGWTYVGTIFNQAAVVCG